MEPRLHRRRKMTSIKANSAIKCAIYPTAEQECLLKRAFLERNRWYNIHCAWFRDAWRQPASELQKWGENHPGSDKDADLVRQRKSFAAGLAWPSLTKMGWPKSVVKPNEKYLRRYGMPVSIFWNAMNEAAEDDLGRAIKTSKIKGHVAFAKPWVRTFTVPLTAKKDLVIDAENEAATVMAPYVEIRENGGVKRMRIPFVSPERRKRDPEIEWFRVKLSDKALSETLSQSAVTVTMPKSGKYFAAIRVFKPEKVHTPTGMECGIDVGIRDCATIAFAPEGSADNIGDTHFEMNFDREKIKAIESRIEHLMKQQSRRVRTWLRVNADGVAKGLTLHGRGMHNATAVYCKHYKSNAYRQSEHRIAALSEKIANIRKDFSEKLSKRVSDSADLIGLEDLNVRGMTKNHHLARSVLRVGFYQIRTAIERKAKGRVILADRWQPSSKTCSFCGAYNPDLKFKHSWVCPSCGKKIERDRNAATNLRPSMQSLSQANMAGKNKIVAGQVADVVKRRTKRGGSTPGPGETQARQTPNGTRRKTERKEALKCEKPESAQGQTCVGSGSVDCGLGLTRNGEPLIGLQLSLFESEFFRLHKSS